MTFFWANTRVSQVFRRILFYGKRGCASYGFKASLHSEVTRPVLGRMFYFEAFTAMNIVHGNLQEVVSVSDIALKHVARRVCAADCRETI